MTVSQSLDLVKLLGALLDDLALLSDAETVEGAEVETELVVDV